MTRVAVLGGGIVGLGVAWSLARRGLHVVLVDTELPGRSSTVAAGMISAAAELDHGEPDLWELTSRSQGRWPEFAAELERCSGAPVHLRRTGTLLVAMDHDEEARLDRRLSLLADAGVAAELLDRAELRRREPALATTVHSAAWLPNDFCVERNRVLGALRTAAARAGVEIVQAVGRLQHVDGRVAGIDVPGRAISADHTVLSAGWRTAAAGPGVLPDTLSGPDGVRPVKGELLDLEVAVPAISATIRTRVDRVPVYLVPHDDHHLTVGATSEEVGADTTATVRAAHDLLVAATTVVPELRDAAIVAHRVGLRPALADNRPLLGDSPLPGLTVATGHYRHGFLLAPLTAEIVGDNVVHALSQGELS
ncbi:MAG TPA: glycine oxidase ThiO [Flexivirga sp.]|uniref:glycine oxidase ThiO n=1 Tax=Flexivirga sp. TaxID=1962927 RepID=UPI002B82F5EA|nr:glycine oxidase ThiO [Flexivirga sp.]HWC21915.1 glycine oxidase ThiO [Flexivirga sp.]